MDAKIQNDLDLIKESVLQTVPAEAIYLFGSYAYGMPNHESDLDIYVVVPDETTGLGELHADVFELLWKKKNIPLDLLVSHASVFNRRKNGSTLERVIAEKGTILYGV